MIRISLTRMQLRFLNIRARERKHLFCENSYKAFLLGIISRCVKSMSLSKEKTKGNCCKLMRVKYTPTKWRVWNWSINQILVDPLQTNKQTFLDYVWGEGSTVLRRWALNWQTQNSLQEIVKSIEIIIACLREMDQLIYRKKKKKNRQAKVIHWYSCEIVCLNASIYLANFTTVMSSLFWNQR